jgi:hypothetical protein
MTGNADISENVKRYNMKKYSNKIYLWLSGIKRAIIVYNSSYS